jgi:hypothetical protein
MEFRDVWCLRMGWIQFDQERIQYEHGNVNFGFLKIINFLSFIQERPFIIELVVDL